MTTSMLARKLSTLKSVLRREGTAGIMAILREKLDVRPLLRSPMDYARLAPSLVSQLARHGRPELLVNALGAGIGDGLLCTVMFRELRRRNHHKLWITSNHTALFVGNEDVDAAIPPLYRYDAVMKRLGVKVVYPWYTSYNPAFDRDEPVPEQHIISVMCQRAGITGPIALRPYIFLSEAEKQRGRLRPRQIAIQSSGLTAKHAMTNKNWYTESYQHVVTALSSRFDFVQLGSASDPPLSGALDLRGKTSLRETAAVLAGSLAFVGQVGFLMHLARAVDCFSVIVYGGRETPAQSGYSCNENLHSQVSCSPCWRLNTCPYDRKCLRMISAADVVAALEAQLERHGSELAVDTTIITQGQIDYNAARDRAARAIHELAWHVLYH
jgi:hypothetical protein